MAEQPHPAAVDESMVRPVQSAHRQVADQLRALIVTGQIRPGERLPSEPNLAGMFGVSRGTVREALRELSAQSLVETSRGSAGGSFVTQPDPESVSKFLESRFGHMSGLNMVTLPDMLQVREMLEIPIARLAAENRTEQHLDMLRSSIGIRTTDDYRRTLTDDGPPHFHTTLLHAAGNPLLSIMTPPVFRVLQLGYLRDDPPDFWQLVSDEHEAILVAVADRDADAAETMMGNHLRSLRSAYEAGESLEQPEPD